MGRRSSCISENTEVYMKRIENCKTVRIVLDIEGGRPKVGFGPSPHSVLEAF